MWIICNCTNIEDYRQEADQLAIQFENRGYNMGGVEKIKEQMKLVPVPI